MRTSESLDEAEWKKVCVRGIGTLKRLKRKEQDVLRQGEAEKVAGGEEGEPGSDPLVARLSGGGGGDTLREAAATTSSSSSRSGRGSHGETVELRRAATMAGGGGGGGGGEEGLSPLSAAPGKRKISSQVRAFEPQAFAEPPCLLQPRIVLCQRSADGSYTTVPHPAYSPSPRKRPGDSPGVSTEIKAIQQTRRLLANARERTRVHTISAAFEALRKQVPCYSYGQKLSKLAILRIACNYILSLARLADLDYSPDLSNMSFSECVEQCTKTLQAEGRSKKRKE
uniref:transcription factor atoh8 n=1 Tax=Pristiophorus japonicus TaxID=55135 RepID=UPI00398ECDA1